MKQSTDSSGIVARSGMDFPLLMSLYGTLQAGRILESVIHNNLLKWGLKVSNFDPRLYFFRRGQSFIIILIVVLDISFSTNDNTLLNQVKSTLSATYDVKLCGHLNIFLRWNITRLPNGIQVTQSSYNNEILPNVGLENFNAVQTPFPQNTNLTMREENEPKLSPTQHLTYRSIIGSISDLGTLARTYMTFPISSLSRSLHDPCQRHMELAKSVLRYVSETLNCYLHVPRSGAMIINNFCATVDSDWGSVLRNLCSTTGFLVAFNGSSVNWRSKNKRFFLFHPVKLTTLLYQPVRNIFLELRGFIRRCFKTSWEDILLPLLSFMSIFRRSYPLF